MKRIGREEREARERERERETEREREREGGREREREGGREREREREGERERGCLDLALGPVSDLFQTCFRPVPCFRPLQQDRLIFAKYCPESLAPVLRCSGSWRNKKRSNEWELPALL